MKEGKVLVLGAGNSKLQRIAVAPVGADPLGNNFEDNFAEVWRVDIDPSCKPDILLNLEHLPWGPPPDGPLPSDYFNEVHAYEVLEHLGGMGDVEFFFSLWKEIWRVLKPGGLVCASTPWWESLWAWQDPGHKRVYSPELLTYLSQGNYKEQIGHTSMTDYRRLFPPPYSFQIGMTQMVGEDPKVAGFSFILVKEVYTDSSD